MQSQTLSSPHDSRSRPFKLTPSMLTFLWDDCPHCFWRQVHLGMRRPEMMLPSVFTTYHKILQDHFTGRCSSAISPDLPPGRCAAAEAWVQSEVLRLPGCVHTCALHGRLDHLIRFDDGSWGIVDYKTTQLGADHAAKYARQLHAYAWALERAARGQLHLSPVTRLGLLCLEPEAMLSFAPGEQAVVSLRPKWIDIPRDDAAFEQFLAQVVRVLARPEPPVPSPGCTVCAYHARRREMERPPDSFSF